MNIQKSRKSSLCYVCAKRPLEDKYKKQTFHIFYILCPIIQNQNILSTSYPLRNSNNSDINGRVLLEVILRTLYYYYCIVDINICKEDGKGHIG